MTAIYSAASTGFFTSLVLILAIGAQNAFVLRQGVLKSHVFAVVSICAISDAILILAGVGGFGMAINAIPSLPFYMSIAGAGFLIFYGALRFYSAITKSGHQDASGDATSLKLTAITCLALTWLNPHVYLDTLGLIGAVSTQFEVRELKIAYAIGATSASFAFFFSLGYGARFLAPYMKTAKTWQVLDFMIAFLMWYLAYGLIASL